MRRAMLAVTAVVVLAVVAGAANAPRFLQWLQPSSPGDETIKVYWQKAESGSASPSELVDLGTMLFVRGFPADAERYFEDAAAALAALPERSLDQEILRAEAWFRVGLVEHSQGRFGAARDAYGRCLKILKGHGRCNFYMGLLEEQTGHPRRAMRYYRMAFRVAPELADPEVNPEVLYSNLGIAAELKAGERERFSSELPLRYLEPGRVASVMGRFLPTPTPTPTPAPSPTPGVSSGPGVPAAGATENGPAVPVLPRVRPRPQPTAEPPAASEGEMQERRRERPRLPEQLRERLEQMRKRGGTNPRMQASPLKPTATPAPTPAPG